MRLLQIIDEFLTIPSVIGNERFFLDHLKKLVQVLPYHVTDHGTFLSVQSSNPSHRIFVAHVDRMGFVPSEQGWKYAQMEIRKKYKVKNRYSEALLKKVGKRIVGIPVTAYINGNWCAEGEVKGVSVHLNKQSVLAEINNIKPQKEMICAYNPSLTIKEQYVSGQLDNVVSVALLYQLMRKGFSGHILFTTGEEIGVSWKQVAQYAKEHNINRVIVLDTASYENKKSIEGEVIISEEDGAAAYDEKMIDSFKNICKHKKIPYRVKKNIPGITRYTEVGKLIRSVKTIRAASIQLPTIYNHTHKETTTKEALNNFRKLVSAIIK